MQSILLKEGDDSHETNPEVKDKETAKKIAHHASADKHKNKPLVLKYIKPGGVHYSLELTNAKFVDGHIKYDVGVLGKNGFDLGIEGHFEIPVKSIFTKGNNKYQPGGIIQGTEISHPHGELSLEISKQLLNSNAKLKLTGTAGTDFEGHNEYGWSLGIEGSLGGSDH